jgi:Contractile injection system tube protein
MSTLVKAILKAVDGEGKDIELMFNPEEISFTRNVSWVPAKGSKGDSSLLPKINFSAVEPYKFTLKQLLFDTYESRESVMTKYVNVIKTGVEAMNKKTDSRPPVYLFTWGETYFYCVITSLTYKLTMFLANGIPVRAIVDISLQEVEKNNLPGNKKSESTGKSRSTGKSPMRSSP